MNEKMSERVRAILHETIQIREIYNNRIKVEDFIEVMDIPHNYLSASGWISLYEKAREMGLCYTDEEVEAFAS